MRSKFLIIWFFLITGVLMAQQPRIPYVEHYLTETGKVSDSQHSVHSRFYCLPMQQYKSNQKLILNAPVLDILGVKNIIPFGFTLSPTSEIQLQNKNVNLQESTIISLRHNDLFNRMKYIFCDSTLYGLHLYCEKLDSHQTDSINKELEYYFKKHDFSNQGITVYSDEDFLVRFDEKLNTLELFSLFHYPVEESVYPGVKQTVYYGPQNFYFSENEYITLAFFNQESKENNVQSAFKLYHTGKKLMDFQYINFVLDDDVVLQYGIRQEFVDRLENGLLREKDTRVFIFREDLEKILRADKIWVRINGKNAAVSYEMPAFQKYSAYTIYEYFRWHVTNPMVKYRGF